jgi:phage terminase large subunit-like protein
MGAALDLFATRPSLAEAVCEDALLLEDEDLAALQYDWAFWARPEQLTPPGDWTKWVILAGRGWGKTRTGAEAIREAVDRARETGEELRIALVGATIADVREVMLDGESGLLNIFPPHQRPRYISTRAKVVFPGTKAVAYLYSAEKPRKLRGPQHHLAWCDELAAWANLDATWDNLMMGLRLGDRPRVIVTTTPRPLPMLVAWEKAANDNDGSIVLTQGTTWRNAANLPPKFFRDVIAAYVGTRLGEQELGGKILGQLEGALFKREWLRHLPPAPRFARIIVAIDPAITTRNDETGIVVVGRAGDRAYVLEDLSGHWSSHEWATKTRDAVNRWKHLAPRGATKIVAEVNRGGDLVKDALRQVDKVTPFKETRAYRGAGKENRAEPIAALYEQGRVIHCSRFEALELQMCTFDPRHQDELRARKKADSPDRLDALVWGLKELGFHVGLARRAADDPDDASAPHRGDPFFDCDA